MAGQKPGGGNGLCDNQDRAVIARLNKLADDFFQARRRASWVPAYLEARGFSAAVQARWHAGHAPATWDALTRHLRGLGYADMLIERAGLARRSQRGSLIDTFRDRLILPVWFVGVALCGTALTAQHVTTLGRAADLQAGEVLVAFDGDPAGSRAAARAYHLLCAATDNLAAVDFQPGEDPAHILATQGPAALAAMLSEHAHPLADVVVDGEVGKWDRWLAYAEGQINAMRAAAWLIAAMPPAHVGRQVARLAGRLGLDHALVTEAVTDEVSRAWAPQDGWSPSVRSRRGGRI